MKNVKVDAKSKMNKLMRVINRNIRPAHLPPNLYEWALGGSTLAPRTFAPTYFGTFAPTYFGTFAPTYFGTFAPTYFGTFAPTFYKK